VPHVGRRKAVLSESKLELKGYEDLEISTQILVQDALNRGIEVTVLDRTANFLKLERDGKTEYVKQATKTAKDNYMTFLIMENKSVCKQLLHSNDLIVPAGMAFDDADDALRYCRSVSWDKLVVKPTTTNFGIGISICDQQTISSELESAITEALSFSESVIVEEFVEGDEFRFLVIDFETIAICQRVPANVRGNGVSSVADLVAEKNRDPRRGKGHVTPLEKIELGNAERTVLREDYRYDAGSIPGKGETVYLRRNSNISTGGDSIDVTDQVDSSYKEIAERAAACVDARVCGVDLIIPNRAEAGRYAILELNFNPVLYIHNYPYEGKNRRVGEQLLDLLGF
jgi:D-alanine-D-alanine ligase-like ATP-grasp enzyme